VRRGHRAVRGEFLNADSKKEDRNGPFSCSEGKKGGQRGEKNRPTRVDFGDPQKKRGESSHSTRIREEEQGKGPLMKSKGGRTVEWRRKWGNCR